MIQAVVLNHRLEIVEYLEDEVSYVICGENMIIISWQMWEDLVAGKDLNKYCYNFEDRYTENIRERNHRHNLMYVFLELKLTQIQRLLPCELVSIIGSYLHLQ